MAKKTDKCLITATDPLGRVVKLYGGAWYGHIVKSHPEMSGQIGKVETTIVNPNVILERSTQNSLVYSSPTLAGQYCNVYVYIDASDSGLVRTALIGWRLAGSGKIIWQK